MRALIVIVILIGAALFFLSSTETEDGRGANSVSAWDGPRQPREELVESPMLANEVEADARGHVTVFLGDNEGGDDAGELRLNVTGRVLDPRGAGVAGLALAYRASADLGAADDTSQVRCDSAGDFSLQAHSTYAELSCEDSRWTLIFAGVETSGTKSFSLTLIAAPTTPCAGTVVDRAGHRIEGARVQVGGRVEIPRLRYLTGHEFVRRAETDDRGRFDLGRVPLLSPTTLTVQTPDLGSTEIELVSAEDHDLSIELDGVR